MPSTIDVTLQGLPPAELTAIRLLAGVIIALLASAQRLLQSAVLGSLGFTLPSLFYAAAMQTVPTPVLTFIVTSTRPWPWRWLSPS